MEKNYNIIEFDFHKNYYFLSEKGCFEVSKSISNEQYRELNKRYYQKTKSWLFSFLFEGGQIPKKLSILKFVLLDLEDIDFYTKQTIIELFEDLIGHIDILELKGKTICFYYENIDLSFKDIIHTINNDFNTKVKIYESGKLNLNKPQDFQNLFEIYLQHNNNYSRFYTNNSILIIDLASKDISFIKILKPIILHKVIQDPQFEKLVYSLFDNNLNITKTACDMFMHRNTINNKIEMIVKETGLNIQNFYDALAMYILLNVK